MQLDEMYRQCAGLCLDAGIPVDGEPCGAVHRWLAQNVKMRPGTEFFVVLGVCGAMADLQAEANGYKSQAHQAATRAFGTA